MTQTNCLTSLPVSLERDLNILGVRSASSFAVRLTKALPVSSQKTVLDENGNFAVRLTKALPVSSQKTVLDENGNPEF